ncbi:daxx-like protein [Andrena cerasifolii]|uniref:daxx-like protein n=1 Tax=Andrena cerasifolii TaxID=2819439 RepID=UPI004037687C
MEKDEVICISSDDEEKRTEQTESNKERVSVIKSQDDSVSPVKTEVISEETERKETCGKKRKVSEMSSDGDIGLENSKKVFVLEEGSNVEESNTKQCANELSSKEESKEKVILKPKLIVKERKTFSPVGQDIFPMFISLCLQKDRSEDMKAIVNKLKRRYEQLDAAYANSEAFINFLNEKRNCITNSQVYVHITDVMNEMKNRCIGKSTLLLNGRNYASSASKTIDNCSNEAIASCSSTERVTDSDDLKESNENYEDAQEDNPVSEKIKKIERAMLHCQKIIVKLEESELDFDGESNSNYIKLEKYKYRMVELYNKYCEYTGENADAERQYLRPKHFSTTGIVAVDHAITSFINSKISKRNKHKKIGAFAQAIIFPDFRDILECVKKCNELHDLDLDTKKQQQIAKKAFAELGEYLQRSRRNDYWDTFSLFLENQDDDPALKNPELAEKLIQNKREGEKRLTNVFQEFVRKQEEMKDEICDSKTSSENEEDEEDSIENEDEDIDNENDTSLDDMNLSIEQDENSTDGGKPSKGGKDGTDEPSSDKTDPDVIEVDEKCKINASDKLKDGDDNNLKSTSDDNNVRSNSADGSTNIPNPKDNSKSESTEKMDTAPLPDPSPDAILPTEVDENTEVDKSLVGEVKENEPNNINDESADNIPLEKEKPLLRVRSFAKPPTTWEDVREKIDKSSTGGGTSKTLNSSGIIDLTAEVPNETPTLAQCTIQIGSNVLPLVKGKYKTLVIPAGKSIINVKNITNNYVRLNPRDMGASNLIKSQNGRIITSMHQAVDINRGPTIMRLPATVSTNHQTNASNQAKNVQIKHFNRKIIEIPQTNRTVLLTKKQEETALQHPSKPK